MIAFFIVSLFRYIKASSPKLNMVIVVNFTFYVCTPLLDALVLSSHEYGVSRGQCDVLCQVCTVPLNNLPHFVYTPQVVK